MAKVKCIKVRALFAKHKVRFARAEQLTMIKSDNGKLKKNTEQS